LDYYSEFWNLETTSFDCFSRSESVFRLAVIRQLPVFRKSAIVGAIHMDLVKFQVALLAADPPDKRQSSARWLVS